MVLFLWLLIMYLEHHLGLGPAAFCWYGPELATQLWLWTRNLHLLWVVSWLHSPSLQNPNPTVARDRQIWWSSRLCREGGMEWREWATWSNSATNPLCGMGPSRTVPFCRLIWPMRHRLPASDPGKHNTEYGSWLPFFQSWEKNYT